MACGEPQYRSLSRAERRERIVWAAKLEMLENGLDEASMDDIAARAGTTKPTIYAHFKSKDELFAAVVEFIKEKFLGMLAAPRTTPPTQSRRFLSSVVDSWSWHAGEMPLATSASRWPPLLDRRHLLGPFTTLSMPEPVSPWLPTYVLVNSSAIQSGTPNSFSGRQLAAR